MRATWGPVVLAAVLLTASLAQALPAGQADAALPSLEGATRASATLPRLTDAFKVDHPTGTQVASTAPTLGPGPKALPPSPLTALLSGLQAARTEEQAMAAYFGYFLASGMDVPPSVPAQFEENSTISFTHDVGDVDHDGVQDFAVDAYCTAFSGCPPMFNTLDASGVRSSLISYCSTPHLVRLLSGASGTEIWNQSLDTPHAVPQSISTGGCSLEFVVGTLPLAEGMRGLLVYRIQIVHDLFNERFQIKNDLRLLDPGKGGESSWDYEQDGQYLYTADTAGFNEFAQEGQNLVLNPIIEEAPHHGVQYLQPGQGPILLVQGVGMRSVITSTSQPDPLGFVSVLFLTNDYQPDEWLARLDWTTGAEAWHVKTFEPRTDRSVFVQLLATTPLAGSYGPAGADAYSVQSAGAAQRLHDAYWDQQACCFDLSGDGVPDVVYRTIEWANKPSTNTEGPFDWDAHIIGFSGADGTTTFTQQVVTYSTNPLAPVVFAQALGDVDGDHHDDFLMHTVYRNYTYIHVLSVRSGADGSELWRITNPRNTITQPIGDLDHDGGQDFLLLEWKDFDLPWYLATRGSIMYGDLTNITHVPLKVFSGRDGRVLWRDASFTAVADLVPFLAAVRFNGIADLDHDGVGDLPSDDPIMLPDRTVIHQTVIVSPGTGKVLFKVVSAGAFAIPALAGDLDGDGTDDLAMLNGDINDLWLTSVSGSDGHALWSRRLMDSRVSSYLQVLPNIGLHPVDALTHPGHDLVVEFQLQTNTYGGFIFTSSMKQQLSGTRGLNGSVVWALPGIYDHAGRSSRAGASPASELFAKALDRQAHPLAAQAGRLAGLGLPGLLAFAVATAGSYFLVRRRPE